jgi:predicted CXXCH cytochrome family protein
MKTNVVKSVVVTLFVAVSIFATVSVLRPKYIGLREGKADENYLKSTDCKACHEGHFQSWDKTHHSKMTQLASSESVLGDFEKNHTFEYLGVKSKMQRRGGEFFIDQTYQNGKTESLKIVMTIGSRRMQQYVSEKNGQNYRLPIAWNISEKRWISLNGSFFYPDGENYQQHTTQWDTNCVFCHNVKAQPNYNFQTKQAKTEVSELGVACGSCHGEGAEHAEKFGSPLSRVFSSGEKHIIQPERIDADRSTMICGHCHGQRVPQPETRIREILSKGDPYNAGEDLSQFYIPIHQATKIGNVSFQSRFWADGSPRLTAYEYQGLTNSPCFLKTKSSGHISSVSGEKISCLSCHSMHEGDVKGMITEQKRTNQACTQCHTQYEKADVLTEHTKHSADSKGSNCYSCHMPEVLYGVMEFHKTHQISNPQPILTATKSVPNACNQCHVDQSVNWAIAETKKKWFGYKDTEIVTDKQFNEPEGVRGLFAGDALTRALMADAMLKHGDANWFSPYLAEAFADENYPIVRYFAANGLMANNWNLSKPDYLADSSKRDEQIRQWFAKIDSARRDEARRTAERLRKLRNNVDIEVGE